MGELEHMGTSEFIYFFFLLLVLLSCCSAFLGKTQQIPNWLLKMYLLSLIIWNITDIYYKGRRSSPKSLHLERVRELLH